MSRTATPADVIEGRARWCVVEGNCRDVLPTLPVVDAVVTDPPYGIGEAAGRAITRGQGRGRFATAKNRDYGDLDWDDAPPPARAVGGRLG